jgi:hypothetical protein
MIMRKFQNVCTNASCITNITPQRVIMMVENFGTEDETYTCRDCGAYVVYIPVDVADIEGDDAEVVS